MTTCSRCGAYSPNPECYVCAETHPPHREDYDEDQDEPRMREEETPED